MNIQSHPLVLRPVGFKPVWTLVDIAAVALRATFRSKWSAL